jgi:hypothetical protein
LFDFRIRWRLQFLTAVHPHPVKLLFNLLPPFLPLFNLSEALSKLLQLLLD